jgi:hypothetical protein
LAWNELFSKDNESTIKEEDNDKSKLTAKKNRLRYLSIVLSDRSGKTEQKKKRVEGMKRAAEKTSRSLNVADAGSVA